ncbi:Oligopeptide transport system permease protein OppC [Corynebacterium atrinae]|uniref:ABC transporter permease n=1 Tax=Corynebacterium atrinae TaxID=1336740 RepID=UPI0025B5902F|nr:ABC transporter permease [Corynebacterium atrinae]WJY63024.1 Oligopeptide transport system permease protein OppC [Corynebacterium atrinae]
MSKDNNKRRHDLSMDTARENLGVRPVAPVADLTPASEFGSQATGGHDPETLLAIEAAPERAVGTNKLRLYVRRFFRNKLAVVGLIIFAGLVLASIFGGYLSQWSYDEPDFMNLSTPPSSEHWFGTTDGGNDLFAQTVHGLGRSLTIAVLVSLATLVLSAVIGAGAALYGGFMEKAVLAVIHFLLAIPTFLLIALLVADSAGDWKILVVVFILFGWMYPARVIWSLALSVRENDYVRAARFMGVSRARTVVRHIIPNIGSLLIIQFMLSIVSTVMAETGLSFLGLGVKLPDVSLGTLLSVGSGALQSAPWQFYFPAATLTLLTVSMAFIADGLRDALDPNSKSGGKA